MKYCGSCGGSWSQSVKQSHHSFSHSTQSMAGSGFTSTQQSHFVAIKRINKLVHGPLLSVPTPHLLSTMFILLFLLLLQLILIIYRSSQSSITGSNWAISRLNVNLLVNTADFLMWLWIEKRCFIQQQQDWCEVGIDSRLDNGSWYYIAELQVTLQKPSNHLLKACITINCWITGF